MADFGRQRLVRDGGAARMMYQLMGVADPAHYLHSLYFRRALESLGAFEPARILDAGCGTGDYTVYLADRYPRAEVHGIDIDAARVERNTAALQRLALPNASFAQGDLTTIDWVDHFDLIVSVDVLEHIVKQREALSRLYRSLRPGGWAFLHIPTVRVKPVPFSNHLRAFQRWAEEEHIAEEQTAESFAAAVESTGFRLKSVERTFGWFTGEMATSLFALPFARTTMNQVLQALLAPACRVMAWADLLGWDRTRYAVGVLAQKR